MAISVLDCTGCGVCVGQCPAKEKALTMTKLENVMPEGARKWDYAEKNITYKKLSKNGTATFVTENITQRRHIVNDFLTVVVA